MKRFFAIVAMLGLMMTASVSTAIAQSGNAIENAAEQVEDAAQNAADQAANAVDNAADQAQQAVSGAKDKAKKVAEDVAKLTEGDEKEVELSGFRQRIKQIFIEGGVGFMTVVLICLILGLALCIERIIYLNLSTTNTESLLNKVEDALNKGGLDAAKEVCRNTSGPVASIFYQGLDRGNGNIDEIEKSIEQYGGVQMSLLERNLSWISLFIALAPMLGFMGTVIGMIDAFDRIATANTVSANIVAGGIKIALITTVSGLIVAIILQIFYNYILSKIDSLTLDMENASIDLVDLIYRHKLKG